jgi:hypothetical protein
MNLMIVPHTNISKLHKIEINPLHHTSFKENIPNNNQDQMSPNEDRRLTVS